MFVLVPNSVDDNDNDKQPPNYRASPDFWFDWILILV